MNALQPVSALRHSNAFSNGLSLDEVRRGAPAVFAHSPHQRTGQTYTFIPSERVLAGLMQVGFVPVEVRQARTRHRIEHARHLVRLRRRLETVTLHDAIPEIIFLNSHDGTSTYQLRVGLHRVVCTNGLIVSLGAFPSLRVAHRGDIVEEVVVGALEIAERFELLASQVERMEQRMLTRDERIQFAERALALRYPVNAPSGVQAIDLLTSRRSEDLDDSVWTVLNRLQENAMRGGLMHRSSSGRWVRTRRIASIREDLRINSGLWDLASELVAA